MKNGESMEEDKVFMAWCQLFIITELAKEDAEEVRVQSSCGVFVQIQQLEDVGTTRLLKYQIRCT